jgi:glyoxylase-like metal-dependent hydrolase (beta-lactamase superfamily II)
MANNRADVERLNRLYFRQVLSGRDFACNDEVARQMVNFSYLIGDVETRDALLVDPAHAPTELLQMLEADGMQSRGVLLTHYHADHAGGELFGFSIEGVASLLERTSIPVHVQAAERPWVMRSAGLSAADLVVHHSDETVMVGEIAIRLVHTPGHTPGSQCFLVERRLVAGDTLFLNGCGRTDLPGSDPAEMYESLQSRLAHLPDDTVVYPGHLYSSEPAAELAAVREQNPVLTPRTAEEWMRLFGS